MRYKKSIKNIIVNLHIIQYIIRFINNINFDLAVNFDFKNWSAGLYFGYNYFVDISFKNYEDSLIKPPCKVAYCKFVCFYGNRDK